MDHQTPPGTGSGRRALAPVPWNRDGCVALQVSVQGDVPRFDEPMVRDAIAKASLVCDRVEMLERMLNRELWRIGYLARLKLDAGDPMTPRVDVSSSN